VEEQATLKKERELAQTHVQAARANLDAAARAAPQTPRKKPQ
jgi:hypothetical protein